MGSPPFISAQELRSAYAGLQEGAWAPGDLKVTAGAGRSVDVAAGIGFVQGDHDISTIGQGLYRAVNDAVKNSANFELGGVVVADATNPRVDQIVARVLDTTHDALGERKWRLEVLAGTPTAGATLDNRTGAAALPQSCLLLADVVVPAGAASLVAANIRDRRSWARGAYYRVVYTGGSISLTTSAAELPGVANVLRPRLEIASGLVNVRMRGSYQATVALRVMILQTRVDGVMTDGLLTAGGEWFYAPAAGGAPRFDLDETVSAAAGSHLISVFGSESAADVTVLASTTFPIFYEVREVLTPSAQNG